MSRDERAVSNNFLSFFFLRESNIKCIFPFDVDRDDRDELSSHGDFVRINVET